MGMGIIILAQDTWLNWNLESPYCKW
jgi:hypothetical protein